MYRKKTVLIINSKRRLKEIETLSDSEGYEVNYCRSLPLQQNMSRKYQLATLYLDSRAIKDLDKYKNAFQKCRKTLVLIDSTDKRILDAACELDPDDILADQLPDSYISRKIIELLKSPVIIKNRLIKRSFVMLDMNHKKLLIKNHEINLTATESKILQTIMSSKSFTSKNDLLIELESIERTLNKKYLSVIIHRLKKKIRDTSGFELIYSKRGEGYYFSL